jgi:hypothetical protein
MTSIVTAHAAAIQNQGEHRNSPFTAPMTKPRTGCMNGLTKRRQWTTHRHTIHLVSAGVNELQYSI